MYSVASYVVTTHIFIGITAPQCQLSDVTPNMKFYQDYLKQKYNALEFASPDEMLDCFSPQYIELILKKGNSRIPIRQRRDTISRTGGKNTGVEVSDSEYVTLSEALDVKGQKKKIVMIEGGPGMGKTTLAINICKCWAKDELLQGYNAVILLTLRDPEIQASKTIGDLLLIPSDKIRGSVLEEIIQSHGERICFILEGLDELPNHLQNSPLFTKLTEKLSKCMLIYTCRPSSSFLSVRASQTIRINGFTEESVDEYISNTFENEPEMALELKSQVHNNPEVMKVLHIPINVAIICLIFFHYLKLPNRLTELYTLLCLRLILRHIVKRTPNVEQIETLCLLNDLPGEISAEFSQLCYVAYKGICDEKIIFSSADLHDMGIIENQISGLGLLLVAPSTSVYGMKKSYNFLHRTLQEFCAAWHLSTVSTEEQMKLFNLYLFNSEFMAHRLGGISSDVIWKFYSGITQLKDLNIEKIMLPHGYNYVKNKLIKLIELSYEADNKLLCQNVSNYFKGVIDFSYELLDSNYNINSLEYFLSQYQGNIEYITFGSFYNANDKIFKLVVSSLETVLILKNNDLVFNVSLSGISARSFSALANLLSGHQHHIVELYFDGFCKEHLYLLPQMLCSNKILKVLCIKHSSLGCEGANCLANCKNLHLQELRLSFCKLGGPDEIDKRSYEMLKMLGFPFCELTSGVDQIGKMLSRNSSILYIDLSYNNIDDDGVERLVHHLKDNRTLQSLDLSGNQITPFSAIYLREIVNNLLCIKLSNNRSLGHVGIYLILESITVPMRRIDLWGREASYCYKSFAAILDKVKSICFTIPEDHEGCKVICKALVNVKMLKQLEICGMNNLNHHNILNAVEQNNNINTLDINYANFTDEHGADLAKFIKNNKSLSALLVSCSKLSSKGLLLIADALTENTSITTMEVSNGVFDHVSPSCVLEFLYELKQADTLKWLGLWTNVELPFCSLSDNQIEFYRKVNALIQQINYSRNIKGIDPLELEIENYL